MINRSRALTSRAQIILPLLLAAVLLARGVPHVLDAYSGRQGYPLDLDYLINAGRVITGDRPGALYDRSQQPANWRRQYGYFFPGAYAYAPAFALASAPLKEVDGKTAWDISRVIIAISMLALALGTASAFASWPWRAAAFAAVITWQPLLLNARLGQTGAYAAALLGCGIVLFLRNRALGAALLGLTIFKPTIAIGPAIMVLSEKPRVIAAFCLVAGLVALVPFLWLGIDPLRGWIETLATRPLQEYFASNRFNQGIFGRVRINGPEARVALALGLLALVALCHFVERGAGLEAAAAVAVCGSLLANPHSLLYDWGPGFAVILLVRRSARLGALSTDLGAGILMVSMFVAGEVSWSLSDRDATVRPLLLWGLATFALLGVAGLRPLWRAPAKSLGRVTGL